MSTGGTGGRPLYGMSGASAAQQSVDMADSLDRKDMETAARQEHPDTKHHGREDRSFLASVKEALKPGDVKRRASAGEATHEGGRGGIMESMKPSHWEDDEHSKHHKRGGIMNVLRPSSSEGEKHRDATGSEPGHLESMMPGHKEHKNKEGHGISFLDALRPGDSRREDVQQSHHERGSMLDSMNPGDSAPDMPSTSNNNNNSSDPGSMGQQQQQQQQRRKSRGSMSGLGSTLKEKLGLGGERSERNYQYDVFPSTERYEGPSSKGESRKLGDVGSTPRTTTSAMDSQGSIGHHFTSEGHIGGAADKVGGPFSKEGKIGKQFKDTGKSLGKLRHETAVDQHGEGLGFDGVSHRAGCTVYRASSTSRAVAARVRAAA
ncbi:hypothetical protein F5X96DRAFT_667348 [Biscogniauxia mediterranea]|nr:hypothetical protein F5X96DRAFT_667348 [Biscogniauxia mediterranea]